MRRLSVRSPLPALLMALGLAIVAGGPARAVMLPVEIELRLEIATLAPQILTATGSATVNGSGAGGHLQAVALAAGVLVDTTLAPVTDPGAFPITGVRASVSNAAGSAAETPGGVLRGAIGLPGFAKVCLFGKGPACSASLANVSVPLAVVGDGGFGVVTAAVNLTVFGAPWTTGQAAIGTITRMGFAMGPALATSSTGVVGGALQLVTPVHISTNISASAVVPIFAVMTLRFVPEPTTLVLLGLGIAALGAAGARRR